MRRIAAVLLAVVLTAAGGPQAASGAAGATATAAALGPVTNLPLPRYLSLRSDEINVRRGPGLDYRKDWVFRRAGLPVRVVDEYGDWRRIVDSDGAGGTVLVTAAMTTLRDRPVETAVPVAQAEQGVVARLDECRARWCRVGIEGVEGWVLRETLWGTDGAEAGG